MQKVQLYYSMGEAETGMDEHICNGWRVHICALNNNRVLVVYEKDG